MSVKEKLTALANKIRSHTGKTTLLSLDDMATEIDTVAVAMPNALISRAYETLVIPKGCNTISAYAFYYANKKLKSVSVESTRLWGVYYAAFFHCDLLEEFRIADKCNISRFGGKAFNNCSKLKVIDLTNYSGNDIPFLDSVNAFDGVHADCVIIVPAKLYDQWISATNWSAVADMIAPALTYGTARLDSGYTNTAFGVTASHVDSSFVYVPESSAGKAIGFRVFYNNKYCKKVIIAVDKALIGQSSFNSCTSLQSVVFTKTPKQIYSYAFSNCTACLTYDFSACTHVPVLGNGVFTSINDNAKILVPKSLYNTWKSATNWTEWADYIVAV